MRSLAFIMLGAIIAFGCSSKSPGPRNDDAPRRAESRYRDAFVSPSIGQVDGGPPPPDARTPDAGHSRQVTLAAVGDILFARYLSRTHMRRMFRGKRGPFRDVVRILRTADITFGNVESPVMAEPAEFSIHRTLTFRAEPQDMLTLASAGFDVVSLANNHAYDMGTRGPLQSRLEVEAAGLLAIGTGRNLEQARRPAVIENNGVTTALIAHTVWLEGRARRNRHSAIAVVHNNRLTETLTDEVRRVRREVRPDFVVVSLHWGIEYDSHPENRQRTSARAIIDAGADLILGHHPHVIQDIEFYAGGVIAYSLGNFLFDNSETRQRRTVILEATLERSSSGRRVANVVLHPVVADRKTFEPRLARAGEYRSWKSRLKRLAPGADIAPEPDAE